MRSSMVLKKRPRMKMRWLIALTCVVVCCSFPHVCSPSLEVVHKELVIPRPTPKRVPKDRPIQTRHQSSS